VTICKGRARLEKIHSLRTIASSPAHHEISIPGIVGSSNQGVGRKVRAPEEIDACVTQALRAGDVTPRRAADLSPHHDSAAGWFAKLLF
jgi:hypothetical protein